MTLEALEMESNPNSGFERFAIGSITLTDEIVQLTEEELDLDPKARQVVEEFLSEPYVVRGGVARLAWKSRDDREKCIKYQTDRNRWPQVESFAKQMRNGEWDYSRPGPVFIHPSVVSAQATRLKPVNGARRIMAHMEVQHGEFDVLVLCPKPATLADSEA